MASRFRSMSLAVLALASLAASQRTAPEHGASATPAGPATGPSRISEAHAQTAAPAEAPQPNPDRDAYFGETHIHTSLSVDAWVLGNRITGPDDALKYAQGQTIKHPMGYDIKIETPMDFMGVTDHSEYVGVTKLANTPGSAISKMPEAQPMILHDPNNAAEQNKVFLYLLSLTSEPPVKAFMSPQIAGTIWKDNVKIADANNHPGKFTAFCAYEWTSMPDNQNLHRNIFFRECRAVPEMPFSSMDSNHPEDLWKWMDGQRKVGHELLAISHNANVSNGKMYPIDVDSYGRPIDAAWAASRDRNERLIEIKQIKGQSETHPLLSPTDEFASYEIFSGMLGLPPDSGRIDRIQGSFARQALKDGLAMQDVYGYNPYRMGFGAASDSHNTGSPYRQDNFYGAHVVFDDTLQKRMAGVMLGGTIDVRLENPAGLTGVWAEENTRASLFDAMYRKETFGVSGPHIKVRFFGGWGYDKAAVDGRDWVHRAYGAGVPMGGDLKPMPAGKGMAPSFVVWAVKDPTSGSLDRIQIVKGWAKNGQSFEKVYDVAWSGDRKPNPWTGRVPAVRSTVDQTKATYTNENGATELKTVWTDPDFDASLHAFYYARVLEVPTPRWTLIQAVKAGLTPPDVVPDTVQERAWSSPIWYAPSAEARKTASAGTTVEDLKKKGATALNDEQLKALVVGKAFWVRNNVTGEQASENFTAEGQTTIYHVGRNVNVPSGFGPVQRDGYQGTTIPYEIKGGKLITWISQDPYAVTVYKLGDSYFGARSNEFGYANYEIIKTPQAAGNPVADKLNQLSLELGLTEQQRQQIVPFVKEELPQLEALKKNTTLTKEQKIAKLKEIGGSIDAKITPILNPEQQAKYRQMQEERRRKLIERVGSEAIEKAEEEARQLW